MRPFVSIIIPVYNDAERLGLCLRALEAQNYPAELYEIIIVDNGSSESLTYLEADYDHVRVIREEKPGSYAARNKGIMCSKGAILGFTDSDCIPQPEWIDRGVAALAREDNIGLVGGKVEFYFYDENKPTAYELYDSIRNLQQDKYIGVVNYAATANLFTYKEVFDNVGLFNSDVMSGGDRDWGQRVAKRGYKLVYSDDMRVSHPARRTFKQLYKKVVRVVGGHHQWKQESGYTLISAEFLKNLAHDLSPPVRFMSRLLKDERVKGTGNKIKVLLVFMLDKYLRAWTRLRLQFGSKPTR